MGGSEMAAWCSDLGLPDYDALWRWSVDDLGRFWRRVWDRYEVCADGDPSVVLADAAMPGARWFPDVRLSFAEHVFAGKRDDQPALYCASEDSEIEIWDWSRLRRETAGIRAGLERLGVGSGDRVAAVHAEHPGDGRRVSRDRVARGGLVMLLAGLRTTHDRRSVRADRAEGAAGRRRLPVGGRRFDRMALIDELRRALPTLQQTVVLSSTRAPRRLGSAVPGDDRAAAVRAVRVRSPAVDRLLERDHGAAEGDRPRPRRHRPGAPQELPSAPRRAPR